MNFPGTSKLSGCLIALVLASRAAVLGSHANASSARWALMAEGTDYAYYVDSSSIMDLPNRTLQFRTLIDLAAPDIVAGESAYSSVVDWKMDCNAASIGLIRVTAYENNCGEGPSLTTEGQNVPELKPVVPQSALSVALSALCLPPPTSEDDVIEFTRQSWLASRPSGPCSY
jgi:hypothetical protein